jgi:hypothetical protein
MNSRFNRYRIEICDRIALLLQQIEDILDDLFVMRLELEDGEIPVYIPAPVFNPMKTIGKYE